MRAIDAHLEGENSILHAEAPRVGDKICCRSEYSTAGQEHTTENARYYFLGIARCAPFASIAVVLATQLRPRIFEQQRSLEQKAEALGGELCQQLLLVRSPPMLVHGRAFPPRHLTTGLFRHVITIRQTPLPTSPAPSAQYAPQQKPPDRGGILLGLPEEAGQVQP